MRNPITLLRVWNTQIHVKMGVALISLTTVILAGFGVYQYVGLKSKNLASLNNLAEITVQRLAENLADPIWNFIPSLFDQIVRSEMREQSIYAVRVVGEQNLGKDFVGKQRDHDWQIVEMSGEIPSDDIISIRRDIIRNSAKLATVELYMSLKFVRVELWRELLRILATIVVLDIALLFLLVVTVQSLFIRPITQILTIANAVADGDFSQEIVVWQEDEIGRLAEAFRNMRVTIGLVLHEMEALMQAVQAGTLNFRGDADRFSGDWRALVLGVNNILNAFMTPYSATIASIERLSDGDITGKITAEYQGEFNIIRNKLNAMMGALNEVVLDVKSAADTVAENGRELNASAVQMSQRASEQAALTEEVSASMEQMASKIHQSAENAMRTEKIALQAARDIQEGGQVVARTVSAMQQIAKKISAIEDISRQTRMLSLNATIEAAKAQDYGKGFAVVAAEVRTLANRSRLVAEEMTQLVNSCITISEQARTILDKLIPQIQDTAELVQEINAANSEQSTGAAHINMAIQQLDQVTQQNAATAEEVTSTAERLANQSSQLRTTMEFFRIDETSGTIEQTAID